jgi:hypothetical protein
VDRTGRKQYERTSNQFTVQQVFGGSAVMFYALYLDQKHGIRSQDWAIRTGDDFSSSPIYWLYEQWRRGYRLRTVFEWNYKFT